MATKDWKKRITKFGIEYSKGNKIVYYLPRPDLINSKSIFRISIWENRNESPIIEKDFLSRTQALNFAKQYMRTH